jgi:hypothetical protein
MPPPINADISSILDEKFGKNKLELFSQKEIEESISSSANYEELYQNSLEVLQKMEENFFNFYGERFIFDRELDTTNPITIFEQEGAEILEDSKRIVWDNSISDASLTMVERLSNIQKEVIADIEKDKEDGTINNKHTIGVNGIIHQWKGM